MKLAGSSVTQLIVFILSFWQPSVIPDVISLTTRKNSYFKGGGWEGEKGTVLLHLVHFKAMLILPRQCSCAAGTEASWRHAQEETAPR